MKRQSWMDWVGGVALGGGIICLLGGPSWSAVGGAQTNTTTSSISTKTVYHDRQIQVNVYNYETRVLGLATIESHDPDYDYLEESNRSVYDQTFNSAPSSQEVSAAVQAASNAVHGELSLAPRGTIHVGAPVLTINSSSSSSETNTVETGRTETVTTTTYIGPQTILIGDEQSQTFQVAAGGTHYDTLIKTDINRDVTTTTTTNQKATYTVSGSVVISPIVLKMDGKEKLEASGGDWRPHPGKFSMDHRVLFDFYGSGFPVAMEWVGPNDGLLCKPKANGTVDGTCLFGTSTGFANGYEQLASLDENLDGKVTGKELKGLYVWQDRNGNARAEKNELKSVEEAGVTMINIAHKDYKSTFTMKGKTCTMYDWWPTTLEVKKVKRSV